MTYTELQVTTNFTFLRGASHPEELVDRAVELGYPTLAVTDRNTVAGVVRAHTAAKKKGLRLIAGCRLGILDGPELLVYPTNLAAWSSLCSLLSTGNLRAEKGECRLYTADVFQQAKGLHVVALPPQTLNEEFQVEPSFETALLGYKEAFGNRLSLAVTRRYNGDDGKQLFLLAQLARKLSVPLVATNDVHYHHPQRRQLQDVLTCIREKCTVFNAGYRLLPNAERYLKGETEMARLFRAHPGAIYRTQEIAGDCTFSLDELRYQYPEEITTEGRTPQEELTRLVWQGAREIFGEPLPAKTSKALLHELSFIEQMNYAAYFLTVYDVVRFARSRNILCQGRGSAANSTVCFCLGITSVNPEKFDLLFERFISAARAEPPDIDVDFEHERREEVIQYIYEKYGRNRAAIVATVTQMHQKGAVRDVGKVMGLTADTLDLLSGNMWEATDQPTEAARIAALGMNPNDPHLCKSLRLIREYVGFPRQLGQHTGGFVITRGRLTDLCPVLNARMPGRTCIEWNKDDIEALGFLKIDVLALGMLTCIRKAFCLAKKHYNRNLTLANVPQDDPAVYEMICKADTVGVFQIESRAQQAMLPRLKPQTFYDLVIEVAIVRPGPIQGDMVHPYLRRRSGEEPVEYPSKELKGILGRTLGVPLFQEQAMKIAIVAAGFSAAEADELRRSMATFKLPGKVALFQQKLTKGMVENGYSKEYAGRVFKQLEGFGAYGFPESHAASFALLVYVSSWLKCRYPDVFVCALLNSLPMGFYQPAQLVQDARKHGVNVLPVDVNFSDWDHTLETPLPANEEGKDLCPVRLGFRLIKGIREADMRCLTEKRNGGFKTINDLREAGLTDAVLERLAAADAFRSLGLDRREALWEVGTKDGPEALFAGQTPPDAVGESAALPALQPSEHVVQDYAATALSLKAHPVSFVRPQLNQLQVVPAAGLAALKNGQPVKVAGLVLVRQRPGTAKGVWFMTVEDETGFANLVIFPNVVEQCRKALVGSRLFLAEGTVQVEGEVIHVIVKKGYDVSKLLRRLTAGADDPPLHALSRAGEKGPGPEKKTATQEKLFPDARNFK